MKKINKKKLIINTLLFVVLPFIINIIVESFSNKRFFAGVEVLINEPYIFLCNTLIIAVTLSVCIFLRRYRYFGITVISLAWIVLGFANFLLLSNRVLPLTANDLQLLDLLSITIKRYLSPFALAAVSLGVVALMVGIFILIAKAPPVKEKYDFKKPLIFFLIVVSLSYGNLRYAMSSGALETRFPELAKSYLKNGFAYSFSLSLVDNGVDKVDGYSKELINSITNEYNTTDENNIKKPNIIFLQLESFFDVKALNCVKFSENPIPNFTKLASENPSGLITVPTIGAGTVNTEFEIITGMRITDFGAGEYPYKTILTENTCESIANNLKGHGYTSHFLHNYRGTFYGRNKVYANLGYDYFYGLESMSGYEETPNGWIKDNILTEYINNCLDSTTGTDLINAVSVQAHGGYGDVSDYEKHITLTKCNNDSLSASYEYYANQLYEMDIFLGEFIESLYNRDEDIILVVYGDHLPSLDIKDTDLNGRNVYQTDYFIWNNMGLNYKSENLYAYQISSIVLDSINIHNGVINACHQKYKTNQKYSYYLRALEYDVLYGEKYAYNGQNPYAISEMKKSSRSLQITNIVKQEGTEATYIVTGKGFTNKTKVVVNNFTLVPTEYIDENTLSFKKKSYDGKSPVILWEKDVGYSNEYEP